MDLAAREAELLALDAQLEAKQREAVREADATLEAQAARLDAILGRGTDLAPAKSSTLEVDTHEDGLASSSSARSREEKSGNESAAKPSLVPGKPGPRQRPGPRKRGDGPQISGISRSPTSANSRNSNFGASRNNNVQDEAEFSGSMTSPSGGGQGSPKEMGPDAVIRLQRAKLKVLAEDLQKAEARIKVLSNDSISHKKKTKEVNDENARLKKRIQSLEGTKDKDKGEAGKLRERVQELEQQISSLNKERKDADRAAKQAENEAHTKDVRLSRALEDIERLKDKLQEVDSARRENLDGSDAEVKHLRGELRRRERQVTELMAAFKKQLKLIDVLKRQKIHLEAARMLSFTEEEFSRTLAAHH